MALERLGAQRVNKFEAHVALRQGPGWFRFRFRFWFRLRFRALVAERPARPLRVPHLFAENRCRLSCVPWEKVEAGDYDWAKLTMAYWPDRVREKCVTDKSFAIAHDLEHLYDEPDRARRRQGGADEHHAAIQQGA